MALTGDGLNLKFFIYVTRSLHALAKIFECVCQLRKKIHEVDILILSKHLYPRHFIAFHKGKKNMFTTCSRGVQPGSSGLSLSVLRRLSIFRASRGRLLYPRSQGCVLPPTQIMLSGCFQRQLTLGLPSLLIRP